MNMSSLATRFVNADVSKKADVDALIEAAAPFGGVDVMVVNARIRRATTARTSAKRAIAG